jgi:membrane protease YdiL (CAAX protease family)
LDTIFTLRWKPGLDVVAVLVSCVLVTGALYTATVIVTAEAGGGILYFLLYAVLAATVFGVGIPLAWMTLYRKRPIAELGLSSRYLGLSIVLQLVLAGAQYAATLGQVELPALMEMAPLLALALATGFFEALFWRGWVFWRLEEAFGLIPAVLLGSLLYAAYHVGYAMPLQEMAFLFLVGMFFALVFRLTRNIFILWPVLQPMGQLVTLLRDGLELPPLATLGFVEVLVVMLALVWLANRIYRKRQQPLSKTVIRPA